MGARGLDSQPGGGVGEDEVSHETAEILNP